MQNIAARSPPLNRLIALFLTFGLALLAGFSGMYWVLKIGGQPAFNEPAVPLAASMPLPVDRQTVARALGGGVAKKAPPPTLASAAPAPAPTSNRFILTGVLANRYKGGAALISVDGSPARPYRVGSAVDGSLLLQSVSSRSAVLASSASAPAEIVLELPVSSR